MHDRVRGNKRPDTVQHGCDLNVVLGERLQIVMNEGGILGRFPLHQLAHRSVSIIAQLIAPVVGVRADDRQTADRF